MHTWQFDLTYRSGLLDGDRMRSPRGTQVREMGIELLGEHVTADDKHDDNVKPRALYLRTPGPRHPGLLQLTWLSDRWPPLRTPPPTGHLNWGNGTSVVEFTLRSAPTTVTAAALWHFFTTTAAENWVACRFRTRSGVLFKRGHTEYVSATHILNSLANRWELLNSWSPPTEPAPREPAVVPEDILEQLRAHTTIAAIRHCAPATAHQIATNPDSGTPAIREVPLEFDLDLVCAAEDPVVLVWFRVLCAFAEIASLGRYTPTGLGAVTTTAIAGQADLVPETTSDQPSPDRSTPCPSTSHP
ncbi:hypothetical protein [Nocardia sp. NPDC058705]|uniref:hypothetical protein n=1 Tax=Nocardia TaxID=1817 RepID=UPI0036CAA59E